MDSTTHDNTRQRLVEAAGEIFAELGYHRSTIKQITDRAGANIAAVNYHFGDKQNLYLEVLRYTYGCALEKYPSDMGLGADAAPEERLRAFIWSFLMRILDEGRPAWHGRLMSREMAEPSAALDVIVNEHIQPNFQFITQTVRDLLGCGATEAAVRLYTGSVVGQCLFYHFARPVMSRLYGEFNLSRAEIDAVAEHISRLVLAGIRQGSEGVGSGRGRSGP